MTLRELQLHFAAALLRGEPAALVTAVQGDERADAAARVDLYRDMYRIRLVEVLGEIYPRVMARLGDAWPELAERYVRRHPSRTPSLRHFGAHLAELLAQDPLASLAQLEWARYDLFDAVDETVLTRDMLAGRDLPSLPLRRIAASALITTPHDADAQWHEREVAGPATLLVWREGNTLWHRRVDDEEARALAACDGALTLAALCDRYAESRDVEAATQLVFAHVGRWITDGVLAAF